MSNLLKSKGWRKWTAFILTLAALSVLVGLGKADAWAIVAALGVFAPSQAASDIAHRGSK